MGEGSSVKAVLDIKGFAMAVLRLVYRESVKRNMPKSRFGDLPHTHKTPDDANGQGALFSNILAASRGAD